MTTEAIKELIELCRAAQCTIAMEACQTGAVARVTAMRGEVTKGTSVYLDRNDPRAGELLREAAARVQ